MIFAYLYCKTFLPFLTLYEKTFPPWPTDFSQIYTYFLLNNWLIATVIIQGSERGCVSYGINSILQAVLPCEQAAFHPLRAILHD